jgi:hypothetical protein
MAGLFDILSNTDQQQAANAQIAGINQGYSQLSDLYGQGRGAATGAFNTGYGNLATQYGAGQGALTSGYGAGGNDITSNYGAGRNALSTNYGAALAPWTQNYNQAQAGTTMLGNALGLNGATGGATALDAFKNANPGYQFGLQQGENAINADNAAKGYLGSGNSALALQKFGQDYANQNYGSWINQLQPYMGQANTAAGGIAGVNTGLGQGLNQSFQGQGQGTANLNAGLGSQLNQNYQGLGGAQNANQMGLGSALLGSYGGQGNAAYGAQTSIGNANANAALGNLTASQNMWNVLGGGLNLGSQLLGFGGGGNMFGGSPVGQLGNVSNVAKMNPSGFGGW